MTPSKPMRGVATALMLSAMAGGMPNTISAREIRPYKECLNCGELHQHNNSFCSPDCCKGWKNKKRGNND